MTPSRPAPADPLVRMARRTVGRTATRIFRTAPVAGTVVVAFLLLISAATGGFDKVRDDEVPAVGLNETVDAGFATVSVTGVRLLPDSDELSHRHPGDRWIAVVAQLTVTMDRTLSGNEAVTAFRLRGVPGLRDDIGHGIPFGGVLARDGQLLTGLEPGVPERVGILWEQDPSAPLPTRADVEVYQFTQGVNSITGETDYWRPGDAPAARIAGVTVADRRAG